MRFFTTATFTPILTIHLLSVVSAQSVPPFSDACVTCLANIMMTTSPSCDIVTMVSPLPADLRLTAKQRACFCPLAASDTWTKPCISGAGACSSADIAPIYTSMWAVKTLCDVGGTSGTGTGSGIGSGGNTNMLGTPAAPKNGAGRLVLGTLSNKVSTSISALAVVLAVALFL